jgi:hypothetical protein
MSICKLKTCHRQLNKEDNMKNNARDRLVKSMAKILAELNGHDLPPSPMVSKYEFDAEAILDYLQGEGLINIDRLEVEVGYEQRKVTGMARFQKLREIFNKS